MKIHKLGNMTRGWFVGNFSPTVINTESVEVAVKKYNAGEHEARHYHKIATEITVIIDGEVSINGSKYCSGDIIVMDPLDVCDFQAITDVTTTVVKIPGATNDKYLGEPDD